MTQIDNCSQIEFAADTTGDFTFYYTQNDEFNRPYRVMARKLSDSKPAEIFVEPEKTNYVDLATTKDGSHLIIQSSSKEDAEVQVMKREEGASPSLLVPRQEGSIYVDHL